jgi:hypothetical protein
MRMLLALTLLSLPSLALAGDDQPYPPPPPPGGGAPMPPPPPEPGQGQPPGPPGPPPGDQQPYQQPPPGGYQQPGYAQPMYTQPARSLRNGMTFEANIGFGMLQFSGDSESESEGAVAGISLGIGGWINEKMAITARLAPVTYHESNDFIDFYLSAIFLGPSVQYWIDDHIWLGGGAGIAIAYAQISGDGELADNSRTGFGLDLRAGYTFSSPTTESTWNVSAEITPGFYSDNDEGGAGRFTGFALLFGYQHL